MKERFTALYERLSRDDEQQGESNSIVNQKKYLEDYARSKGFHNIRHFTDDGYTGTNFNRPGFQAMLEEINAGNVDVVLIKDMSRLGRNYLQVGFYTEMVFPEKGVRFIAVNNGIDSDNPTENEFTPFLNIMNEWYAKDTSKKIKAVFRNRMENGLRCSGAIPYGFYRKPDDKQTLYIDEESAKVVRRIFDMAASGVSVSVIAETLTKEKVLIPAAYQEQAQGQVSRKHDFKDPYLWHIHTVITILERQEYLGHTVLGKTICDNFKTKKRRKATEEELLIFPNTHEAIVSKKKWDMANKLRKRAPKRVARGTFTHRLSGLIYCADCGARLGFSAPPYHKIEAGTATDSDSSFNCGNYRNRNHCCTNHYIKSSDLEAVLLQAVRVTSQYVLENEDEFADQLMELWEMKQQQSSSDDRKELNTAKKRLSELDALIQGLYENQIKGTMPERQVQRLIAQYDEEQITLESRISEIEKAAEISAPKKADIRRFISLIKKYKNIEELTDTMLYEFIDHVNVHAPTGGRTRYRQQKIDVFFNFIGDYMPPTEQITEEERIAMIDAVAKEKLENKRKQQSERKKQWLADIKERAKTDPEAAKELDEYHARHRANSARTRANRKARMEVDPEYRAKQEEIQKRRYKANNERYHRNHVPIAELEKLAETDPKAAEELTSRRKIQAEKNRENVQRREERMSQDLEYAELTKARRDASNKKHSAKRKAHLDDLKKRAETDPEAAAELQAYRDYHKEASRRSRAKKKEHQEVA